LSAGRGFFGMNRRRTVPLLLIFGICLALPLPAAADWTDAGGVSCRYVESGAPGPAGNRLRIDLDAGIDSTADFKGVVLRRIEKRIDVLTSPMTTWRRHVTPVTCEGRQATVFNIDRIRINRPEGWYGHLIIDESGGMLERSRFEPGPADQFELYPGGPLAPGATREASGSEIEISMAYDPSWVRRGNLIVEGTQGDDAVDFGMRPGKDYQMTVNLNARADGRHPDPDIVPVAAFDDAIFRGNDGDDRVTAIGAGPLGPVSDTIEFFAVGGPGDDVLLGHHGVDGLRGGRDSDLIRGGSGNDLALTGNAGRDRVYGGPGDDFMGGVDNRGIDFGIDRVRGGTGVDEFWGYRDGNRDFIDCGPGVEKDVQIDPFLDVHPGCEPGAIHG